MVILKMELGDQDEEETKTCCWIDAVQGTCVICLEPMKRATMIDKCYHTYCFDCIRAWVEHLQYLNSDVKCPLCKCAFETVLTDLKENNQFTVRNLKCPVIINRGYRMREEVYAGRLCICKVEGHEVPSSKLVRRSFHKSFAEMQSWIERELSIICGPDEDVSLLVCLLRSLLSKYSLDEEHQQQHHIVEALQDFLFDKATTFVRELHLFSISTWSLQAYDAGVEYRCSREHCGTGCCVVRQHER